MTSYQGQQEAEDIGDVKSKDWGCRAPCRLGGGSGGRTHTPYTVLQGPSGLTVGLWSGGKVSVLLWGLARASRGWLVSL